MLSRVSINISRSRTTKPTRNDISIPPAAAAPVNAADTAILVIDLQDGLLELSKTVDVARLRTAAARLAKLDTPMLASIHVGPVHA